MSPCSVGGMATEWRHYEKKLKAIGRKWSNDEISCPAFAGKRFGLRSEYGEEIDCVCGKVVGT